MINELIIPYNIDIYKAKSNTVNINTKHNTTKTEYLQSIVGEIYLAIIEEKIEEDFIIRFNGIINKYHNETLRNNFAQIVTNYCSTPEIIESEHMIRNREYVIQTLKRISCEQSFV